MQNPDPEHRRKLEVEDPFSDAEIRNIEEAIGRSLPKDYLDFVRKFGSPFVAGSVDGSQHFAIQGFLDAGDVVDYIEMNTELAAEGAFAIAQSDSGNPYVIAENDSVYYIDYYSSMHGKDLKAEKVSDSFSDFVARIVLDED
jgi:hypothetical protein